MELSSDITLVHPLWERADSELCNNNELGIFNRLVDVYVIACAIGIREDKAITEIDSPLTPPKSIGRNTHRENEDIRAILEFMLQNAILHTKTVKFDVDERLKLAFDPNYNIKNFSPSNFLTGFANHGIEEIFKQIDSKSPLIALTELYTYFEGMTDDKYEDILRTITLDALNND